MHARHCGIVLLLFTACSGPAHPEVHAVIADTPTHTVTAPARVALVCPPEPEEDTEEAAFEPVDDDSEDAFDVSLVVQRALGEDARCAPQLFARLNFLQDFGLARVHRQETIVEVSASSSGGGVEGGGDLYVARVDRARCRVQLTVGTAWNEGELISPARVGVARASSVMRILADGAYLRAYAPTDPEAALFQLLVRMEPFREARSDTAQTFVLRGPIYAAPPRVEGEPQPSTVGYLVATRDMRDGLSNLRARLASGLEDEDDEARPRALPEFVYVMPVDGAFEDYAVASFIVRAFPLHGRNGGSLVALIDTTTGRYRWVLETRSAVLGSSVQWRGLHRGYLVGEYRSDHPGGAYAEAGGIVLLRLDDGATFALDVPGIFERGRSLLAFSLEGQDAAREEACIEVTTRAFAMSSGYPISELENAPWWCRDHEVLVRLRAELEQRCTPLRSLPSVRVDAGQLAVRTLEGEREIDLDAVVDAASRQPARKN